LIGGRETAMQGVAQRNEGRVLENMRVKRKRKKKIITNESRAVQSMSMAHLRLAFPL
jgi:hypothetical protein